MLPRTFVITSDAKTLDVIAQVLGEFFIPFEPCEELSAAIKRVLTEPFDAVIVDCDDVQNAALVFNSMRGSNLNFRAMTVAIADGKAGVPTAFRMGAKMVLSKPLSLEQARNTLRHALAIQRRDAQEGGKAMAAAAGSVSLAPRNRADHPEVGAQQAHQVVNEEETREALPTYPVSLVQQSAPGPSPVAQAAGAASAPARSKSDVGSGQIPAGKISLDPISTAGVSSPKVSSSQTSGKAAPAVAQEPVQEPKQAAEPPQPSVVESKPTLTFSMTASAQRQRNPALLPALVVVLIAVAAGAAWFTQPSLRNEVLRQYGKLTHRKQAATASLAPRAMAQNQASVASVPAGTASDVATAPAAAGTSAPEDAVVQSAPVAQGFQDDNTAVAVAPPAAATPTGASEPVIVPEELADAHVVHRVNAWYPTRARHAHITGSVVVNAQVAVDGSVTAADVVSGNPQLVLAAQEAVKLWRYQPYYENGQPVAFQTQATISFPPAPVKSQK